MEQKLPRISFLYESSRKNNLKIYIKLFFIMVFALCSNLRVFSQEVVTVSGTVVASIDGLSLPGVNIFEKGTTNGTITNILGKYSITLENAENAVLVFSYVGYETYEVEVLGKATIDCRLIEDITTLNEVVVIGYGSSTKRDITGALSVVDSDVVTSRPVTRVEEALQGRVSGVSVVQSDHQPGSVPTIVIRGRNSMGLDGSSSGPLWIVDGFPYAGTVNPNDVESITVLKDASATAIYGSRGSNGVILVTTKKGSRDKQSVNFLSNFSFSQVRDKVDLLTGPQIIELEGGFDDGADTDWQDLILRDGMRQEYGVSYSGGNNKSRTFISLNYQDNQGILVNTYYKSLQSRINTERKLSDHFKFSNIFSATISDDNKTNINYTDYSFTSRNALLFPSTKKPMDEEGNYLYHQDIGLSNPYAMVQERINSDRVNKIYNFLSGEANFFNEKLKAKVSLGGTIGNTHNVNFWPKTVQGIQSGLGQAGQKYIWEASWTNENQLSYAHFFRGHSIKAIGFFTQEFNRYGNFWASNSNLATDDLSYHGMYLNLDNRTLGNGVAQNTLMSYGVRFNYNFKSKYYFTATVRRDGSSRFAKNNKWAVFPAFATSWRLNEEEFMQGFSWLSNSKIRATYGKTGNQAIPAVQTLEQYAEGSEYVVLGVPEVPQLGLVQTVIQNDDLMWETTSQANVGLDLGFLNERFTLVVDYYNKLTTDLLFKKLVTGGQIQYYNAGSVSNEGFELSIGAGIVDNENFRWSINANYSFNRNKVVELGDVEEIKQNPLFPGFINDPLTYLRTGYPMGIFYGYQVEGVFVDEEDVASHPEQTAIPAEPGEYKLKDVNNDGVVDANDQTIIGNAEPTYVFGFNNLFSYKSFDFGIFIQGSIGNEIYNVNNAALRAGAKQYNRHIDYLNRWTEDNRYTDIPKAGAVSTQSVSAYIEDGTYIRVKDINLTYNLPTKFANTIKVEKLSVSVSAQNWFTFTDYKGYDPEVSFRSGNTEQGIDYSAYPSTKSITLGLKVTL